MMPDQDNSFSERIRQLRRERGLSQELMADLLGVTRQTIIAVETGRSQPSLPLGLGLATLLETDIVDIFTDLLPVIDIAQIPSSARRSIEPQETVDKQAEVNMNQITPWNPIREIDELHRELDRLFSESSPASKVIVPAINVHEDDKTINIEAAIPGYKDEEVDVEVTDNVLTIRGEKKEDEKKETKNWIRREYGHESFERSFSLTKEIDQTQIKAEIESGLLKIELPKIAPAKPKSTKIKIAKK